MNFSQFKFRFSKQSGETLIEVILAVVILVFVLTGTYTVLNQAVNENVNVKNRVVALNIAREGIEAVRNIRDTNWLQYSGDRRNQWLCIASDTNGCTEQLSTSSDPYYTVDNVNGVYVLNAVGSAVELDISSVQDFSSFLLYEDSVNSRLTHDDNSGNNPETIFYRQIELRVQRPFEGTSLDTNPSTSSDDDPNDLCDSSSTCADAKLQVISRVAWDEGVGTEEVVLETQLFDYYERDEY